METPVAVMCDVDALGAEEPQSLLYVGLSRARSQLTILLNRAVLPAYRACVERGFREQLSTTRLA